MGDNEYWLGLYWRNNEYDIAFLKEFCDFCLESRVGKICITPWKSFIVKGINRKYKLNLEKLLGKKRNQCTSFLFRIKLALACRR